MLVNVVVPVPPRPTPSCAATLQVPPLMVGTPVDAEVLMPVPPYWAPTAVAVHVPAVIVPIWVMLV